MVMINLQNIEYAIDIVEWRIQMKNKLSTVRRVMAAMLMACLLLTVGNVSSNAEYGVMPCGEAIDPRSGESE